MCPTGYRYVDYCTAGRDLFADLGPTCRPVQPVDQSAHRAIDFCRAYAVFGQNHGDDRRGHADSSKIARRKSIVTLRMASIWR